MTADEDKNKKLSQDSPLALSYGGMLRWVLPSMLSLAVFGAVPTFLVAGWPGVWAELGAGVVVIGVMLGNGVIVVAAAGKSARDASVAFSASSWIRMLICPGLTALAWLIFGLDIMSLGVWMLIFYLSGLAIECAWVVRALRKHVRQFAADGKTADAEGGR